jgi:hypothetical protein
MIGRDHSRLRGKVALVPANNGIRARAREGSQATHPGNALSVLLNAVVQPADIRNRVLLRALRLFPSNAFDLL